MNYQDILNEVEAEFQIEIKDRDLETSRFEIIRDFCSRILEEFNVDIDNTIKVQLCQNIFGDSEIISITNLMSGINNILPKPCIGLFDIISPIKQNMFAFFETSLEYYKFCDLVLTQIYDVCNPIIDSISTQKQLLEDIYKFKARTNEVMVKTENEKLMLEESQAANNDLNQGFDELKVIKSNEENKLLQILNLKQIAQRKEQQALNTLNEKKRLIEFIKTKMNRSFHCEEQIEKLKNDVSTFLKTTSKYNSKIDEMKASQVDLMQMNQIFEDRCRSLNNIHQSIIEFKTREDRKKDADTLKDLGKINEQFLKVQKENKIALEFTQNEIEQLRTTLDRECDSKVNLSKLEEIEKELKEDHGLKMEMIALCEKETKLKDSFQREERKLKTQEEELTKSAKRENKYYKEQMKALLKCASSVPNY